MRILKPLIKLVLFVILLAVVYALGLKYTALPAALTPQEIFKDDYSELKSDLTKDAASDSSTSGMSETALEFLDKVEDSYEAKDSSAAGSDKQTSTTDQANEPPSAIDKAKETVDQYQNSLDEQKKQLDSY